MTAPFYFKEKEYNFYIQTANPKANKKTKATQKKFFSLFLEKIKHLVDAGIAIFEESKYFLHFFSSNLKILWFSQEEEEEADNSNQWYQWYSPSHSKTLFYRDSSESFLPPSF